MNLSWTHVSVAIMMTVSTMSLALSSFFYFSAVHERKLIATMEKQGLSLEDHDHEQNQLRRQLLTNDKNEGLDYYVDVEEEEEEDEEEDVLENQLERRRLGSGTSSEKFLINTNKPKFLPPPGNFDVPFSFYYDAVTGSQSLFLSKPNVGVFPNSNDVTKENIKETLWNLGTPTRNAYYTQRCTVTNGSYDNNFWPPKIQIFENMCDITFCWRKDGSSKRGCVWLRAGQGWYFDSDTDLAGNVPIVEATIVGGSGDFAKYYGNAIIETYLTSKESDSGDDVVLKLSLFYKKNKKWPNIPRNTRTIFDGMAARARPLLPNTTATITDGDIAEKEERDGIIVT